MFPRWLQGKWISDLTTHRVMTGMHCRPTLTKFRVHEPTETSGFCWQRDLWTKYKAARFCLSRSRSLWCQDVPKATLAHQLCWQNFVTDSVRSSPSRCACSPTDRTKSCCFSGFVSSRRRSRSCVLQSFHLRSVPTRRTQRPLETVNCELDWEAVKQGGKSTRVH